MITVELFSCAGGMAEGFRRAGIHITQAFDFSKDACASYTKNLGERPVCIDVRELARMVRTGWGPQRIDLLVADPPCTPWSRAGKRLGLKDDRDMLADTTDIIRLLAPRRFLIGNVPGLDDSTAIDTVQKMIGSLARDGYCVRDFARLDAANYGVPQHRVRPFWFGHLSGPCITWPAPTHCNPTELATLHLPGIGLRPWVTCRAALEGIPLAELGRPVRLKWRTDANAPSVLDRPAKVVPSSRPGNRGATLEIAAKSRGATLLTGPNHRPSRADRPARTITRNPMADGSVLAVSSKHPASAADAPANTICANDGGGAQAIEWPMPETGIAPNAVVISERAAAILQGFPPGWAFVGKTKRSRWAQLGQAMPPALAEAVARSILRTIELERKDSHAAHSEIETHP